MERSSDLDAPKIGCLTRLNDLIDLLATQKRVLVVMNPCWWIALMKVSIDACPTNQIDHSALDTKCVSVVVDRKGARSMFDG
jgi:hypothetical protein